MKKEALCKRFQKSTALDIATRTTNISRLPHSARRVMKYGLPAYAIEPICDNVQGQLLVFSICQGLCYGSALYSLLLSHRHRMSTWALMACATLGVFLGVLVIASVSPFLALVPARISYIFKGIVFDLFWGLFCRCFHPTLGAIMLGIFTNHLQPLCSAEPRAADAAKSS